MDSFLRSPHGGRLWVCAGALVAASSLPVHPQDLRRPKKLIATGWDKADTVRLRENLEPMERRPFDGVVLEVNGRDEEGKSIPLRWAFQNAKWEREWFRSGVDGQTSSADVAWYDDVELYRLP